MFTKHGRRCIALLVVLTMVISLMPFQILATEMNPQDHKDGVMGQKVSETFEEKPVDESVLVQIQEKIDEFLIRYLGCTVIDFGQIQIVVEGMDWETYQTARYELSELENSVITLMENDKLSEVQLETLISSNTVLCSLSDALEMRNAEDNEVSLYATTVNVLDGKVSITDTASSMTASGNTVTVTAKGGLFSQTTNTITICNVSGKTATLSFNYSASNYSSFSESNATGSKSVLMASGTTITMSIKGKSGIIGTTATLTLSNFSLVEAATSSNVTFEYDSSLGNITIEGTAVSSGTTIEGISVDTGVAAVATSGSGVTFLGWVNTADGTVLSKLASDTLKPSESMTVKAVFVNSSSIAWFLAGGTNMFSNLNEAATFASGANSKIVVPMNDGTLPTGNYTIPSGVTLLIPIDAANTLYTTEPNIVNASGYYTQPAKYSAYRTMTMASGANIEVNGAISIAGSQDSGSRWTASNTGAAGFIKMEENSSITINNGASLYAWGYITGKGSVVANSGAKVYENFQITSYHGGDVTNNYINDEEHGIFPITQYYVQNIEVPLTLYSGAIEYTHFAATVSSQKVTQLFEFVGNGNGMFNLTSGYLVKDYIEDKDRLKIDIDGTFSVDSLVIKKTVALVFTLNINSKKLDLPINHNLTISINSGTTTINQDLVMFPGSEIIIDSDAKCVLASGINLFLYDYDQLYTSYEGKNYSYCGIYNEAIIPVVNAPGRTFTRKATDLVDAAIEVNGMLDVSAGCIYTTEGGANIYSTGTGIIKTNPGTQTNTWQAIRINESKTPVYLEIPINPAWLKNEESGSFVKSGDITGITTYYYDHYGCEYDEGCTGGKWYAGQHTENTEVVTSTCTEDGYVKHDCSCGHSYISDIVSASNHANVNEDTEWQIDSVNHWQICPDCNQKVNLGEHTFENLTAENHKCSECSLQASIDHVGMNLNYENMIYVLDIFQTVGFEEAYLKENAGVMVWPVAEYEALEEIFYNEEYAIQGLQTYKETDYYYVQSEGIWTRNLHEDAYYVGYVKLQDGSYLFSDGILYSPSIYAYNQLGKSVENGEVKAETQSLCVALLNYISAAQQYFYDDLAEDDLVNYKLSVEQKALDWSKAELNLADAIPEGKQIENPDSNVFTAIGKNLLFEEVISLGAIYKIDDETVESAQECGTIFWTGTELAELNDVPSVANFGEGEKVLVEKYRERVDQWVSIFPDLAPKDMADTQYYFMGYLIHEDGTVSYTEVMSYTIEQYIGNKVGNASAAMEAFAQRLYFYERAAKIALG